MTGVQTHLLQCCSSATLATMLLGLPLSEKKNYHYYTLIYSNCCLYLGYYTHN